MERKPNDFEKTLVLLARLLTNYQYAFRGTASLVLQGIRMNVADIDILADKKTALACNQLLKDYLTEAVSLKESSRFKSWFGKFSVNQIPVEVMGEWRIKNQKGDWSQPFDASERKLVTLNDQEVWVTPIAEELQVFALMGRWNAYHKIKKQLKEEKVRELQTALF